MSENHGEPVQRDGTRYFLGSMPARKGHHPQGVVERLPLSAIDFHELIENAKQLTAIDYSPHFDLVSESLKNFDALIAVLPRLDPGQKYVDTRVLRRRFHSSALSVLSTARTYLDATPHLLSNEMRPEPDALEAFKTTTHRLFDEHRHYRLCYGLRNVLAHTSALPMNIEAIRGQDGTPQYRLTAGRDQMLAASKKWHATTKEDLRSGPTTIDVGAALQAFGDDLKEIYRAVAAARLAAARPTLRRFLSACEKGNTPDDEPLILAQVREQTLRPDVGRSLDLTHGIYQPPEYFRALLRLSEGVPVPNEEDGHAGGRPLAISQRAANVLQAQIISSTPALRSALGAAVEDPRIASRALADLATVATVAMKEVEALTGVSPLADLQSYRIVDNHE